MTVEQDTRQIINHLLSTGSCGEAEIQKLYRLLCKQTHPDLTGKDGSQFLKVQQAFEQLQGNSSLSTSFPRLENFDPFQLLRDMGHALPLSPQASLYISLDRYLSLGLLSFKMRSKENLRNRNISVLRTVLFWAQQYDPAFIDIFLRLNRNIFQFSQSTQQMKNYTYGKKITLDGFRIFFEYQEMGREGSRKVCGEKLVLAGRIITLAVGASNPLVDFCSWALKEITLEPALILKGQTAQG